MEEIYQITAALRYLPFGKHVAVLTDARFSGVSTGACIGHVGPEALAGGPLAHIRDGDIIRLDPEAGVLTTVGVDDLTGRPRATRSPAHAEPDNLCACPGERREGGSLGHDGFHEKALQAVWRRVAWNRCPAARERCNQLRRTAGGTRTGTEEEQVWEIRKYREHCWRN